MASLKVVKEVSLLNSVEYNELPDELWALLSRLERPDLLDFARRWKMFLPNTCTLSGRSREEEVPLVVDRWDECRVMLMFSNPCSHPRSLFTNDEDPDDTAR
jgi:hypothetical protein